MEYLPNPIEVEEFVDKFCESKKELQGEVTFTGFHQTEKRWRATFQDDAMCMEYEGAIDPLRTWLEKQED